MIALALSLLGLGGIGTALHLAGWLMPALGWLKGLPREVWYVLAALALIGGGWWWHSHAVNAAYTQGKKDGIAARDREWHGAIEAWNHTADVLRARAEAADRARAEQERQIHDQEVRTIDARARTLLLRGPGQAAAHCVRSEQVPGFPAPTGGRDPAAGAADDGMAGLPAEQPMATVPWPELVERSGPADEDRSEVSAWRRWYERESAAWAQRKVAPPALPDPTIGK